MWPNKEEGEPEWVATEREQFNTFRDKNSDGKMDHEEVKQWIIPPDYDHSEAEAKHLLHESDNDKVCKVSNSLSQKKINFVHFTIVISKRI